MMNLTKTEILNSALCIVAEEGNVECVRQLIRAGADVRANDHSALRIAASYGHGDVVRVLMQAGASLFALPVKMRWDYACPTRLADKSGADAAVLSTEDPLQKGEAI